MHRFSLIYSMAVQPMFGSKINQLSESTFRQRPSLIKSSGFKARVASVLIGGDDSPNDLNQQLRDYLISLPACAYHHQPIKYLCLSPNCPSSNYTLCSHPHCRTLHSHPDSDLIELSSFNQFIASNCSSLLLLASKVKKYMEDWKLRMTIEADKLIARTKYIFENVYMSEVPRMIRQGAYRGLSSSKLYEYVKHDSLENNIQQRIQIEGLRNEVAARITEFEQNFTKLVASRQYQTLAMSEIIRSTQSESPFAIMGKMDIHRFESKVLDSKEDFEDICRMLKENRAPAFASISTIFRASEHHYSADEFHRAVDGKGPLLFLVKTTIGRRFGAFVNCRIDQREEWIPDATGLSFVFSLDRRESYKLKSEAKSRLKAVFGGPEGPQVGSGCDLYIVDQCHLRRNSGANLGGSYRLPNYLQYGTPKAKSYLANEQNFLVEEYEAFSMQ